MKKFNTRTNRKPPKGWDLIEPQLQELQQRMREAEKDPSEGKTIECLHCGCGGCASCDI